MPKNYAGIKRACQIYCMMSQIADRRCQMRQMSDVRLSSYTRAPRSTSLGLGLGGVEYREGEAVYRWDPLFIPYAGSLFDTLCAAEYDEYCCLERILSTLSHNDSTYSIISLDILYSIVLCILYMY